MEPIAIIGMGCRFPGPKGKPIRTPETLWELLRSGQDILREIPAERWPIDDYYDPDPNASGKMYIRKGYFLDDIDQFDPTFFNLAPREAASLDPQQRLVLEVSWEALEYANIPPATLVGSQTGIFVSTFWDDYSAQRLYAGDPDAINRYSLLSNERAMASGRLGHFLDVYGPNMIIDTACSGSLTAVHIASQSLANGECDLAFAGGAFLLLAPETVVGLCQMGALAADGYSKAFDALADGYGTGEGCGMVLLKRLSDAQADGDMILAVIRGSAINHDGRSRTVTTPSGLAQEKLIRQALGKAEIEPDKVQYVETHGTGTNIGDPIEVLTLAEVYGQSRTMPLAIGSVKTNIGHLNAAAGVAGLIKVVLAMQHGEIPPTLHVNQLNPRIPWEKLALTVPTEVTPWQTENGAARLAGVSSFGLSGSNAHVIVEEAPNVPSQLPTERSVRPTHLLPLSAKTIEALHAQVQSYYDYLREDPGQQWEHICHTAATGREHFAHRLALVASSKDDALHALSAIKQDISQATYHHYARRRPPQIAFLFTGQGTQYVGMGQELYETEPTFRAIIDRCDVVFQEVLGRSLLELLYSDSNQQPATSNQQPITNNNDLMASHPCGQAANFAIECALADLWRTWGIEPDFILGHSLGDFAAAYTAGTISLEDGLRLVTKRGQLMETAVGSMVSVLASEADVLPLIADYTDVTIGVINGPASTVLSGGHESIARLTKQLQGAGFKTRKLDIPVAAHSPLLDPVLDDFEQAVRSIPLNSPKLTVISSMTGQPVTDELTDPTYWRHHLRNTVRFADGVTTLHEQGVELFVEIGPGATLLGIAQTIYDFGFQIYEIASSDATLVNQKSKIENPSMLPSLRKGQSEWQQMLTSLGELYVHGVEIDWPNFDRGYVRQKVVLPTYPFQRQRCWIDVPKRRARVEQLRPLIDKMTRSPVVKEIIFETEVSVDTLPFLKDHRVYDAVVSPGACHLSMALSAGELAFEQPRGFILEDVVLPQPFVVPPDSQEHDINVKGQTAQVILTPIEGSQRYETQLISIDADAELQTHLTGIVACQDTPLPSPCDIETLRQQHTVPFDLTDFHNRLADIQITLGPSFRWIEALWHPQTSTASTDASKRSALAQLSCPATIESTDGYLLHPGILDACLQVAGTTQYNLAQNDLTERENPLLPFALGSLHLYQTATGTSWWCHVTETDIHKWDIALMDESGALIATITEFEMRAASPSAVQYKNIWCRWLYQVDWQEESLTQIPTQISTQTLSLAGETWLILADQRGVGATLAGQLHEQGANPILVYADAMLKDLSQSTILTNSIESTIESYAMHPENAEHYEALFEMLMTDRTLAGIVHLWSLDTEGLIDELQGAIDWMGAAQHACGSTLHLLQRLLAYPMQSPNLWLVTENAQAVHAQDTMAGLAQSALWGMGNVIGQEHPEFNCVRIDLDIGDVDGPEHLWHEISAGLLGRSVPEEFPNMMREDQVAIREHGRYVARLKSFQPTSTDADINAVLPCQPEATYLVTGGLSGIGLATATWLAAQGANHLILLGRRPPNAEAETTINGLRAEGVSVQVAQCDVTDYEQLQQVLGQIDQANPLRGVVHAAGVLDDGVLANQNWSRFHRVLHPKLEGAWHLHELTQEIPLDFFVLYSSVAALLGNPGQANHAAANAFLDALAHHRNVQKNNTAKNNTAKNNTAKNNTVSINWGGWSEIGAAAKLTQEGNGKHIANGYELMTPSQGLAALEHILTHATSSPIAQMAVLPMHWQKFFQNGTYRSSFLTEIADRVMATTAHSASQSSLSSPVTIRRTLQNCPPDQRAYILQSHLQKQVAATLGLPVSNSAESTLSIHTALTEMGLDSLMALELRRQLQETLELSLSSTLIFTYPTIESLQTFLLTKLFPSEEAVEKNQRQPADDETATPVEIIVPDEGIGDRTTHDLMAQIAAQFESLDD